MADSPPSLRQPTAAPPPEPEVYTVREIVTRIHRTLQSAFGLIWVQGEITNYRPHTSGHHYFTLKDSSAQLACVLFSSDARGLGNLKIRDGLEVRARGEITVYANRGQMQMQVRLLEEVGQGALQARFLALKEQLAAAGLFAPERKKPLPKFPRRIGLVTSASGAALRDFLQVLWRRSPGTEVVLYPVRVQGDGAAEEMVQALEALNTYAASGAPLEVIVLTRGGGSLEDLWEFNEEILAYAIAKSALPVVSAVGHEIDFTIADFVADQRAPTPSVAAEILSEETEKIRTTLAKQARRLQQGVFLQLRERQRELRRLQEHRAWSEPARLLREFSLTLDQSAMALRAGTEEALERAYLRLRHAQELLRARHPLRQLANLQRRLHACAPRLRQTCVQQLRLQQQHCDHLAQLLRAFDPRHTLLRGYTYIRAADGSILTRAASARKYRTLEIVFADDALTVQPLPAGKANPSTS